jgi:CHAD domain-containing protein
MALDRNRLLKPVKKLRKLVNQLDRQPTPDNVHDLRTNMRRVEVVFEALSLDSQGRGKLMLKDLDRLRKRAGKVRDMDVLTSYASTVHLHGEKECVVQLLEHLGAQRRKHAKKLYAEVQRRRRALRKEFKRTPATLVKLIGDGSNSSKGRIVAAGAVATAVELTAQLAAPQRLSRESLHPYRLTVKDLRNILQMAAGAARPKFVDDLGEVKDAIGEWHDWEELVSIAQKSLNHGGGCELITELKRVTKRKCEHAMAAVQTLRKEYLRSSGRPKKGASATSPKMASAPVWEAIAMLAY